jgi:hypothetical protein
MLGQVELLLAARDTDFVRLSDGGVHDRLLVGLKRLLPELRGL